MGRREISPRSIAEDPLSYPGPLYPSSFYLEGAELKEWHPSPPQNRVAVLAIGSNRDPARLLCHLRQTAKEGVYGLRAQIEGCEVVYPAHVSAYGVCTATVFPAPGSFKGMVHFLTRGQVDELCAGEDIGELFDLYELEGVVARSEHFAVKSPLAFVHRSGPLLFEDGLPRRLERVCVLFSPSSSASLAEAHSRICRLLDEPFYFPLSSPGPVGQALQGGDIGWHPDLRVNQGSLLERLPEAKLLASN